MKKLGIVILILFSLFVLAFGLMQTDAGRNYATRLVTNELKDLGIEAEVGSLEGAFPRHVKLKNVVIQNEITIESLDANIEVWRLLKREIGLEFKAQNISFKDYKANAEGELHLSKKSGYIHAIFHEKERDWNVSANFTQGPTGITLAPFSITGELLTAKGTAHLNSNYQPETAHLQIQTKYGFGDVELAAGNQISFTGEILNIPLQGKMDVLFENGAVLLKNWHLGSQYATANGNLEIRSDFLLTGNVEWNIDNLQSLKLPNVYGSSSGKAEFAIVDGKQAVRFDATAADFYYGKLFAAKASIYSDLILPDQGTVDIDLERARYNELHLDTATIEATLNGPWQIYGEGRWKHPLELHMHGNNWNWNHVQIEDITGAVFNYAVALNKPVAISWSSDTFQIPELDLSIAKASATLHVDRKNSRTEATLKLQNAPLDLLSLNRLDLPIPGTVTMDAHILEENEQLNGQFHALIANKEWEGEIHKDRLDINGQGSNFDFNLSIPIHLSLFPFNAQLQLHKSAKGSLAYQGRIEDLIDVFDLGDHRLEGNFDCNLTLGNDLYNPRINGSCNLHNGRYQNYYTGTEFNEILASIEADGDTIQLTQFTSPAIHASGQLKLTAAEQFPYTLDVSILDFKFVDIDLVNAWASGEVHISGNALSGLAKGDINISRSDIAIPDHIPRSIPELKVTYINATQPLPTSETTYKPYPLLLDLNVNAPEGIMISGRGLDSDWKGNFHIGGQLTDIATQGKLELVSGEFNFSSRSFKLTEGSVSFSGKGHQSPTINIAGEMSTRGVTITARLKGPVNAPQITLQSNPPLPLGAIMSYLLFGENIAEISGFQALQLASSLAALAGQGPDMLESTRRALGLDRLRVISQTVEEGGGESIAIQVGKYVSEGVLVSFTQGTEDSSPNINIQVELGGSFVFEAESDQRTEQGKFTIKYTHNY